MNMEIVYGVLITLGIWAVIISLGCVAIDQYWKRRDRRYLNDKTN
jgi:hypothetical protein